MATDPLLAAAGHPPSPAAEFSSPGFSLRSAALGALWQVAAAHWVPSFLTERQAGAALACVLVLHGAAVDAHAWWLAGKKGGRKRSFDFTAGPASLLHAISGVPPALAASGVAGVAGAEKKKAAATPATATTRSRSAARKKSA